MFFLKTAYPSVACFAKERILSDPSFTLILFPSFIYNSFLYKYAATIVKIINPLRPFN